MLIHPYIFIIDIITLILFILTLSKQISLHNHYKNLNGLKYHRLAFMTITVSLVIMLISRITIRFLDYAGYYTIEFEPVVVIVVLFIMKVFTLLTAIFAYMWFRNSKFKFLKIFDKWI